MVTVLHTHKQAGNVNAEVLKEEFARLGQQIKI